MKYFRKNTNDDKIICLLCSHYCHLKNGQTGICGVNKNIDGKLVNLVYSHPISLNVDPVEKKPLYHFLPGSLALSFGTVGCNFKCPFCQNWTISQNHDIDSSIQISPKQMVDIALEHGCKSIAYTYNEPTIFYPYAKDIGLIAKEKGIKNIFVTNGFESKEVIEDMTYWLDGANIDLKSWGDDYYKKVLKGGLEAVKASIKGMKKEGIWVEVTTLLIEGENDDPGDLKEMAKFIANEAGEDTPWHLSAFHPDYKMRDKGITTIPTLQKAYDIAKEAGLKYVYLGNVTIEADTYCPKCKEIVIRRNRYNIIINSLIDGKCPKCHTKIEGVWK